MAGVGDTSWFRRTFGARGGAVSIPREAQAASVVGAWTK